MDKSIEVLGPRGVVVVYRGVERETYSCAPKCERQITLGDSNAYFDATIAETAARNGLAHGRGAGGSEIDARCPVPRIHMAASVLSLASR